ncbi:MAG: FecR domain-containing protein [Pirellulales bacterium]
MMNESDKLQTETAIRELIVSALDGDASEAQLVQLNEALRSDESLRRSARRFLYDDALLAEEIGTLDEAISILKQSAEAPTDIVLPSGERSLSQLHPSVAYPSTAHQSAALQLKESTARNGLISLVRGGMHSALEFVNRHGLAVAAMATFVVAGIAWHHISLMVEFDRLYSLTSAPNAAEHDRIRTDSQRAAIMPGPTSVARATAVVNCEWFDRNSELKFGDQLSPGQRVRLKQGLLQLTFGTGAKVVVEGPADFVATTSTEAILTEGKIAAAVPRFARGYTILTPTAEIVDLGTEFGVNVDGQGTSEVHVFDGDVVARPRENGLARGELLHAQRDEALQFNATDQSGQRISFDRSKFVRRMTPDRMPNELPPLPVTRNLALWLAADVMPVNRDGTSVSTWPDILVGDNKFPDDAWQFDERLCPKWIRDGQGLPAVRFDGWSTYLATSPMATGDRLTAFVVFAPGPTSFASESHGGMLLKYGLDAPSLEFALLPDYSPRARVWASNSDGSTSNVGVLQGPRVKPHYPCAVAYSYDAVGNHSELVVDGKLVGSADAPKPIEQHARKYIGTHAQPWMETYYLGNIYEIIAYDSALDAPDRDRVFQYLSKRYDISLAEP